MSDILTALADSIVRESERLGVPLTETPAYVNLALLQPQTQATVRSIARDLAAL